MSALDFMLLCGEFSVDVDIAIENEKVRQAILNDASEKQIRRIFTKEF